MVDCVDYSDVSRTSSRNGEQTLSHFSTLQLSLRRHLECKQQRKLFREVVAAISGSGHVTVAVLAEKSGSKKAESVWNERWNGGRAEPESVNSSMLVVRNLDARGQLVSVRYEVLQQM